MKQIKHRYGIYMIKNLANGKVYIGQTKNLQSRYNGHLSKLRHNKMTNAHFQSAFNKYGESNFQFSIIETFENPTKEFLNEREDYWMSFYKSMDRKFGYNKQESIPKFIKRFEHTKSLVSTIEERHKYYINKLIKLLTGCPYDKVSKFAYKIAEGVLKKQKYTFEDSFETLKIKVQDKNNKSLKKIYIDKKTFEYTIKLLEPVLPNRIFEIKKGTSEIIKIFSCVNDVLKEYPDISRKALENVIYDKNCSTKKHFFVLESKYRSDKSYISEREKQSLLCGLTLKERIKVYKANYRLKKGIKPRPVQEFICEQVDEQGNTIEKYKSLNDVILAHPEIKKKALEKVLYGNRKSTKGKYFRRILPTNLLLTSSHQF